MRIKITIEYDLDWEDGAHTIEEMMEAEKHDWRLGFVSVSDIEAIGEPNGKVTWEMIP